MNAGEPLTTAEVAEIFKVHPATITRWVHQGLIEPVRRGGVGAFLFDREAVDLAYEIRSTYKADR